MEKDVNALEIVYGTGISKKTGKEYSYIDIQITPTYTKRVFLTAAEQELFNFISSEFTTSVNGIVALCGQYFKFGRGLINNFLTPFGRGCVTGLMSYWIAKFFINLSIKVIAWVNHFIFRG